MASSDAYEAPSIPPREHPQHPYGVRLRIAYDGTDFAGFQRQPVDRTVQGELERSIARIAGHTISIRGAGRTDAGVHALDQVVAFDTSRHIPAAGWRAAIDTVLPADVRVQEAVACEPGYTPRYDALGKHYRYVMQLGERKNPLLRHRAWQLGSPHPLDLGRMREAAALMQGRHDFRAFRAAEDARDNAVRNIGTLALVEGYLDDPTLLAFDVHGDAFMKNMVRILVGTLVDIGRGRRALERVPHMLSAAATRADTGITAPAQGLTLVRVWLGRSAREASEHPR